MRAQLRDAGLCVADRGLSAFPPSDRRKHGGQRNDDRSGSSIRDPRQAAPHRRELLLTPRDTVLVALIEHNERHEHGQQHEIGQDHDGYTEACRDRHFANHLHRDHQNGHEPDQIGE